MTEKLAETSLAEAEKPAEKAEEAAAARYAASWLATAKEAAELAEAVGGALAQTRSGASFFVDDISLRRAVTRDPQQGADASSFHFGVIVEQPEAADDGEAALGALQEELAAGLGAPTGFLGRAGGAAARGPSICVGRRVVGRACHCSATFANPPDPFRFVPAPPFHPAQYPARTRAR